MMVINKENRRVNENGGMSMKPNANETDEFLEELTSIEYDDDDALTLLDDEEASSASKVEIEDDDLASFYADAYDEKPAKPTVYKEEPVPAPKAPTPSVVVEKSPDLTYPRRVEQNTASLDNYLNNSMASRDTVKVEKVTVPPVQPRPVVQPQPVAPSVAPKPVAPAPAKVETNRVDVEARGESLNQLFEKVSNNVRGASNIVNKNVEIKKKIDERFNELKKLQEEHEKNRQRDYDEINAYKDDVYNKLKEKKAEIEQEMSALQQAQAAFEREKQTFASEKQKSLEELNKKEASLNQSYKDRLKSIEQIEDGLVKRKEQLDNEKKALQREKEQCEKDKKELAENLIRFNQLVDDFTKGVDSVGESN